MLSEFCELIAAENVDELKFKMIEIGAHYNIIVTFEDFRDEYYNWSTYSNIIVVGHYDNLDMMIASFFHELGHHTSKFDKNGYKKLKFHQELDAWNAGLIIGHANGYYIKPDTYRKCMDKMLYSYIPYDIREYSGFYQSPAANYFYGENNIKFWTYYNNIFSFNINDNNLITSIFENRKFITENKNMFEIDNHLKQNIMRADKKLFTIYTQYNVPEYHENKNFMILRDTVGLLSFNV
jgi:hypothetical protein